jgi:energy-coupling factor transporter ATP-binding protein EcfA2
MTEKMAKFLILGVYIGKDCAYKKILEDEKYYSLNDAFEYNKNDDTVRRSNIKPLSEDFFAKNISISVIVGKNGSGKSSLLDMVYRIINNFAFKYIKEINLTPVNGINATLFFKINDKIGKIVCAENDTSLWLDDNEIRSDNKEDLIKILKENLFYTIVANFCPRSLIPDDYAGETKNLKKPWIYNLYHKNDSYKTPIVLNPFKGDGQIYISAEYSYNSYILSSIFIEAEKSKKQFIEGYELEDIIYESNQVKVLDKYPHEWDDDNKLPENKDRFDVYEEKKEEFKKALKKENNFTRLIIEAFGFDSKKSLSGKGSDFYLMAYMYLVHKSILITKRYESYEKFIRSLTFKENKFSLEYFNREEQSDKDEIKQLVKQIKKDKSHITRKIYQTVNYINILNAGKLADKNTFSYKKYLDIKPKGMGLEKIISLLPPPFYNSYIELKNKKGKVKFNELSSGEKQFVYTIAILIYHIKNLRSVQQKGRYQYRNFSLILDEAELCFHPEYQRTFIYKLIETLKRLSLSNQHGKINIIFATHSPFILSDVPAQNILYLEDGKPKGKEEFKNPFAANISDILAQSFFLKDNGFIGEFAAEKIKDVITKIKKYSDPKTNGNKKKEKLGMEYKECEDTINLIGEPIIKTKLEQMLPKTGLDKQKEIEYHQKEIERLQAEQKK